MVDVSVWRWFAVGKKKYIFAVKIALMEILVMTSKPAYPPHDGGSVATLSMLLSLQRHGNRVDVLSMNTPKHHVNLADIPPDIRAALNVVTVDVNTDISVGKAAKNLLFSTLPYNIERFFSAEYNSRLAALLHENRYDIVQLEGLAMCLYINTIRRHSEAKIVFRAHNVEHEIWLQACQYERNMLRRAYKKILAKRVKSLEISYLNWYDMIVPITLSDAEFFGRLGNVKPIKVAPTGISSDSELLQLPPVPAVCRDFFYVGALDWQPNCDGLAWFMHNVWGNFVATHPNAQLFVAGRNALPKVVDMLTKSKNTTFVGEVDNIANFMAKHAIMVIPLLYGSGMRIRIVEGMAAARTIIATRQATHGINTSNGINILVANSPNDFINCMEQAYNNDNLRSNIANAARDFVKQNFDNELIINELTDFYNKNL